MNRCLLRPGQEARHTVVASFGERLKLEREKRGMTLEDVSGATKISTRNLKALEQEKFDQLPGGIFNRGFVRAYAKHLGLDEEQVVADYVEAAGESIPSRDELEGRSGLTAQGEEQPKLSPKVPWVALAGLLVLGTLLLAIWIHYSHRQGPQNGSGAAESTVERPGAPASAGANNPATDALPAAVPEAQEPDSAKAGQPSATPAVAPRRAAGAKSAIEISLQAKDEVWVSITADEKPPAAVTLLKGQGMTAHAASHLILRIGNVAALEVSFNGQKVSVPGTAGQVKTLIFTPSGLQALAPAEPPQN
jgi:cytoskeleton protein RodZ